MEVVSQEDFDDLHKDFTALKSDFEDLQGEFEKLRSEYQVLIQTILPLLRVEMLECNHRNKTYHRRDCPDCKGSGKRLLESGQQVKE